MIKFDDDKIQGNEFEISSKFLASSKLDYYHTCEVDRCK